MIRCRPLRTMCALIAATLWVSGCARESPDTPPTVHLGEDMCAECGMIISDERFASATVVESERSQPDTRLFDDFNCMINHEVMNPGPPILRRWVRDHASREWVAAEDAVYLCSADLHTPMASNVAAFAGRAGAEALRAEVGGDLRDFDFIRTAISLDGGCAEHGVAPGEP